MRTRPRTVMYFLLLVLLFSLYPLTAQDAITLTIAVLDDPRSDLTDGARLAVREINAAGGVRINADTRVQLELLPVLDTARDNPDGLIEVLRTQDVIAILGPVTGDEAVNLVPALSELGVPILTPATGDTLLTVDDSGLVFRTRPSDLMQGQAIATFLIDQLGLTNIATAQLDIASTARLLGFATAASVLGVAPSPSLFISDQSALETPVAQLIEADPEAIVVYGAVPPVADLYRALQEGDWDGLFIYPDAETLTSVLADEEVEGVIGVATWAYTFTDAASVNFVNGFVRMYGDVPSDIAAAGYDSIRLLEAALTLPDDLRSNLLALDTVRGVQGVLSPANLSEGETDDNAAITRLSEFGVPEVIALYRDGNIFLPDTSPVELTPTPTPAPTTPTLTITGELQNVRSGPSMDYPILGQLTRGAEAPIVGRSIDSEWAVIDFNGAPGWLAVDLLQVTGNLSSVAVIAPPAIPTPVVTPTPSPAPEADVIIQNAVITPTPIILGQSFTMTVTVSNIGLSPTGTFTVAGTLAPNSLFLSALVPALAPGQSLNVTLTGIFNTTGRFTSSLVVDANNQVNEGAIGEQNNIYNVTYTIDRRILRQAAQTLNLGDTLDLEGSGVQGDVNWNADGGLALDGLFGTRLGILSGIDINAVNFDSINPAVVTRENIPRTELFPGTLIGVTTADGNRGVLRVDAVSDTQITLTFRVYSNT